MPIKFCELLAIAIFNVAWMMTMRMVLLTMAMTVTTLMQNGDAATMPGTHEDLRTALRTVNLRKWLPELLCRDGGGHSGEGSCSTSVETALSHVAEPTAAVTVFGATSSVTVTWV